MKRIILILIIATCAAWLGLHTVRAIGKKRAVTASVAPIEQPPVAASEVSVKPPGTIATSLPAVELSHEQATPKAPLVAGAEVRSIAVPESRLSTPEPSPPPILTSAVGTVEENEIVGASPAEEPAAQWTGTVATAATVDVGEYDIVFPRSAATPATQSTTTATTSTTATSSTSTQDAEEAWAARDRKLSADLHQDAAAGAAKRHNANAEDGSFFGMQAPGKMSAPTRSAREETLPSGVVESLALLAKSQRGPMTNATASAAGDDSPDIESLVQRFPYLHRRIRGAVVIPVLSMVFTDAAERVAFETETSKLIAASALSALLVPASLQDVPFYVENIEALRRQLETTAHTTVRPYSYQPGAPIPPAVTGIELVVIPAH